MKIRRARIDGGESLCSATPENIGRKRCCHIGDMATKASIAVLTAIALTACSTGADTVPTETSPVESSVPDGTFTVDTVPTESTEATTATTNETTEEVVYIYGGRYYSAGDPTIEGKSGLTAMTLSEAQSAGYTTGAGITQDEKSAYDYNMAWDMVAQGKSDSEIVSALMQNGYSNNEEAAQFMVDWVRADYASGQRAYEAPQGTPSGTGSSTSGSTSSGSGSSSSGSGSSGSGSSGSGSSSGSSGSGSSGSGSSGSGSSGSGSGSSGSGSSGSGSGSSGSGNGGSTQPTQPAPTETTAPAPTQPAPTEPAPTEPAPTTAETQAPTPTPVPPTPTPKPAPTITGYRLTGTAWDNATGDKVTGLKFTGSSAQNCVDQFETYCANHNYSVGNYSVVSVWSDGHTESA